MKENGSRRPNAGGLPSAPVNVELAEYTINNRTDQALEDIYRRKPDAVGFSCYIWNIREALELARNLRKVLPETDIWLGGPEVSFDAPRLLEREPEILGVMKGEGEETFAELLECYVLPKTDFWQALDSLSGIAFRRPDGVIHDNPARPVMDISRLPFLYENLEDFDHRIIYYESSRGCPFACSYCLSSIDKTVRFRDLELVKRELDFFLERRVPQVKFVDRTFNCKKSHAMAIWKHILDHDNGVTNFHFEIAADLLDEEELELIGNMRPGLIQLEIGVQSTNPDTIRAIHRRMDLDQVRRAVAKVNGGRNVHQHLDLIAGLPYEDYESFHRSFNDVYAMEPEQLQLGFLKVLKGSYMYETAEEYGILYRQEPPYEVLSTKWLPYGDVLKLKGIEDMVEVYYNSRQFTETLKVMETVFQDPFSMFERLAEYYREKGLWGISHSRLDRYEILYAWLSEAAEKHMEQRWKDALICDLYLRENAKSRPSFAPDPYAHKELLRTLAPELGRLGSQVHGEVLSDGTVLLFDYRSRDPLTNNARTTVLRRPIPQSYVAVDLETTGLDPKKDKIIEIGAVQVENGVETKRFHTMVNPRRELDPRITELTGISGEMVEDAPDIGDIIGEFLEFCGELPLLGHFVIFDYSFLKRAAVNAGLTFERSGIDTLKLCRRFMPPEEKKSLEAACAWYQIPRQQRHRALGDALDARGLYEKLGYLCKTEEDQAAFEPKPLIYKVKREQPASKKQKEDLRYLIKYHKIDLPVQIDHLSRNEVSRLTDQIISQYGRIPDRSEFKKKR